MSVLDWSGNGSLADEGIWLTALFTFLGTLVTIRVGQRRIARQVQNIDSTLNHVGEPITNGQPTVGQRIAKIEDRVDRVDGKLDRITDSLQDLSIRMIEHISDEAQRTSHIEEKVRELDRRRWEAQHGQGITD
tara:strand:+ start:135 stop:533 length:399 start_codon:yes stop_codon:yes gene_type:complete